MPKATKKTDKTVLNSAIPTNQSVLDFLDTLTSSCESALENIKNAMKALTDEDAIPQTIAYPGFVSNAKSRGKVIKWVHNLAGDINAIKYDSLDFLNETDKSSLAAAIFRSKAVTTLIQANCNLTAVAHVLTVHYVEPIISKLNYSLEIAKASYECPFDALKDLLDDIKPMIQESGNHLTNARGFRMLLLGQNRDYIKYIDDVEVAFASVPFENALSQYLTLLPIRVKSLPVLSGGAGGQKKALPILAPKPSSAHPNSDEPPAKLVRVTYVEPMTSKQASINDEKHSRTLAALANAATSALMMEESAAEAIATLEHDQTGIFKVPLPVSSTTADEVRDTFGMLDETPPRKKSKKIKAKKRSVLECLLDKKVKERDSNSKRVSKAALHECPPARPPTPVPMSPEEKNDEDEEPLEDPGGSKKQAEAELQLETMPTAISSSPVQPQEELTLDQRFDSLLSGNGSSDDDHGNEPSVAVKPQGPTELPMQSSLNDGNQ